MILDIFNELNENNGSNYKIEILKKHKDNELLKRVLKMAYDSVAFTYGISMKNISYTQNPYGTLSLESALDDLENRFCTREVTGNDAIKELTSLLENLDEEDAKVLELIIGRDLKINMGRSNINKVFKNLIIKPPYMRCGIYNEKTRKKINFPAIVQLKADGMFQAVTVEFGKVTFTARSGEERKFPHLEKIFKDLPNGVYIGELLVDGIDDRALGNGFINSDEEDKSSVYIQLWDYVTLSEYSRGKDKENKTSYHKRFTDLIAFVPENDRIRIIPFYAVQNIQEALERTSEWMSQGYEGSILKDWSNIFVDHTSPTQLKLKLEIDAEVRITGFQEGTPGTKREKTFGAIIFENDEGTIKGRTSGFTDDQLEDFNSRREELIGKVITVQFNDLTKAKDNDYYALSHPRFIEIRNDKNETDTLERVKELREMAITLGE